MDETTDLGDERQLRCDEMIGDEYGLTDVDDRVDELRDDSRDLRDRVRFC